MTLFEKLTSNARTHRRRIVLPEGTEPRTLNAANRIIADALADIILIGDPAEIHRMATEMNLPEISRATIVNPADEAVINRYAPLLLELRRSKGMTEEESRLTTANPLYLGCLMVKAGDADGQVAGAMNTTANVLRAAFQVIKTRKGIKVVSGAFVMLLPEGSPFGTDGIMVFADCAVVPEPDAEQLADIAVSTAATARDVAGITPRVAMLSFSTKGSAHDPTADKVIEATALAHQMAPELIIDGELQADAAIVPGVAASSPRVASERTRQRLGIPQSECRQHLLQTSTTSRRRTGRRPYPPRSRRTGQRPIPRMLPRRHLQDHNHHLQPSHRAETSINYIRESRSAHTATARTATTQHIRPCLY